MEILNINTLEGPNYWSINHKIAEVTLDTGRYEDLPTERINVFCENLLQLLTEFKDFLYSMGETTVFPENEKTGTWIAQAIEYMALELQSMAGMKCNFGKTIHLKATGKYKIIFAYKAKRAAIYAAHASLRMIEAICENKKYSLKEDILNLKKIALEDGYELSTSVIVEAATAKNIPIKRLDSKSIVQLGYGSAQKRIKATVTDNTSNIAVELASDKYKTKMLLKSENIPVAEGLLLTGYSELEAAISNLGFPLVIKPNNQNHGKGVTLNINTREQALSGFRLAKAFNNRVLAEKFYRGKTYRLLVINYKLVSAVHVTPANVSGNGILTIRELINIVNLDPARGEDHENLLTRIRIDQSTEQCLRLQDVNLDFIPPKGERIFVNQAATSSNGGTSEDVTELIHPEISALAERTARIIGLDICGIDFVAEDISLPLNRIHGKVIEVKASPELRIHTHPLKGKSRNIGKFVVDMLFPKKNNGRIPLIAITGTNRKTATTRLIAHIASAKGFNVGYTSSDGIFIGEQLIEGGDCTDLASAEKVLRDKSVNFAILECDKNGLLHSGLAFDQCDVGIVTDAENDNPFFEDTDSLEEIAQVNSVIPETVKPDGVAILNGDNAYTCNMKSRLKCKVAFFSTGVTDCFFEHCSNGGVAAIYKNRKVMLIKNNVIFLNEGIENIPSTLGGKDTLMIENILAAILATFFIGIDVETIRNALHSFILSPLPDHAEIINN